MACAGVAPQQTQSGISSRVIPCWSHTARAGAVKLGGHALSESIRGSRRISFVALPAAGAARSVGRRLLVLAGGAAAPRSAPHDSRKAGGT